MGEDVAEVDRIGHDPTDTGDVPAGGDRRPDVMGPGAGEWSALLVERPADLGERLPVDESLEAHHDRGPFGWILLEHAIRPDAIPIRGSSGPSA